MGNEKKKKYLPIGTVVRPKDANIELLIVRYDTVSPTGERDYGVCIYPDGPGTNGIVTIDNEDIKEIHFLGYCDKDDKINVF